MPLLNYILFLLSYHVNNKTFHTFVFKKNIYTCHLRQRRHVKIHTQLINILNNKTSTQNELMTRSCAMYRIASLLCTCLLHTFS